MAVSSVQAYHELSRWEQVRGRMLGTGLILPGVAGPVPTDWPAMLTTVPEWAYVRVEELEAGRVEHPLFLAASCVQSRERPLQQDYPLMNWYFRIPITNEELEQHPVWKQGILRAMRDYGMLLGGEIQERWACLFFDPEQWIDVYEFAGQYEGESISKEDQTYYFDLWPGVNWLMMSVFTP